MSRAACQHSVFVPTDGAPIWKPRSANGPMVASCEKCGKVLKYSQAGDRFSRSASAFGRAVRRDAALAMFVAQFSARRGRR